MNTKVINKKSLSCLALLIVIGYFFSQVYSRDISDEFFNDEDYLSSSVAYSVINQIQQGVFSRLLKDSPDLYPYLVEEVTSHDIQLVNEEKKLQHLALVSQLLMELTIASKQYKNLEGVTSLELRDTRLCELAEYLLKVAYEDGDLSKSSDMVAANLLITCAIGSSGYASFSDEALKSAYFKGIKTQTRFNQLSSAILVTMWLDRSSVSYEENIKYLVELKGSLKTSGDLIRLMNHEEDKVVLKTAHLIEEITPDNAIHALKYHLIHSKNETVKLAILDAISKYGIAARPYLAQLRAFLHVSKSDHVKQKLITTLEQINGL